MSVQRRAGTRNFNGESNVERMAAMGNDNAVFQAHILVHCPMHAIHQIILSSDEPEMIEGAMDAVLSNLRSNGYNAHGTALVSDRPSDDLSPRNHGYKQLSRFAKAAHAARKGDDMPGEEVPF